MPASSRTGMLSLSWSSDFASESVTCAPFAFKNRAEATPDFPSPTTSTRLLSNPTVDFCLLYETPDLFTFNNQQSRINNPQSAHLSFRVVSANRANTSEAIQKRT